MFPVMYMSQPVSLTCYCVVEINWDVSHICNGADRGSVRLWRRHFTVETFSWETTVLGIGMFFWEKMSSDGKLRNKEKRQWDETMLPSNRERRREREKQGVNDVHHRLHETNIWEEAPASVLYLHTPQSSLPCPRGPGRLPSSSDW